MTVTAGYVLAGAALIGGGSVWYVSHYVEDGWALLWPAAVVMTPIGAAVGYLVSRLAA
jgi:uncharacterized protein YfiM (DUF2279 family)